MLHDHTFLYVEDDAMSREGLELVIRRVMGVEHLWVFADSADFMQRLNSLPRKPDVILLDIHMRPYSGLDLLKMLRGDPAYAQATVVALTASVMNEEMELLRASGFDGAIAKPINVATFPNLIERAVGGESVWHVTD
jgi:CheY-like chemotaxis protein